MIKITPYYERSAEEREKILELYLNMVADVVPFWPEDVLDGIKDTAIRRRPQRQRKGAYKNLLNEYRIIENYPDRSGREQDAILARELIKEYSQELFLYLYNGKSDSSGHVNKENLRNLLTVEMPLGKLEERLDFRINYVTRTDESDEKKRIAINKRRKENIQQYVFRYDVFSVHKKIYDFIMMLNVNVCPYCNRQYITTIPSKKWESDSILKASPLKEEKNGSVSKISMENNKGTRAQLDHFKNKNRYPWLSLSINNLVPSCGICNLLKHNNDKNILYPYSEGMGLLYTFKTIPKKDRIGEITALLTGAKRAPNDFDVRLEPNPTEKVDKPAMQRAAHSIESFLLNEVYQSHKEYITAMYFQRYVNTDELLMDRIEQFPELFRKGDYMSDKPLTNVEKKAAFEQLKFMLFMMEYHQEAWDKCPLAKLTHDISKEIEMLYTDEKNNKPY